jgi:predicted phage terminase large subunit-like protein
MSTAAAFNRVVIRPQPGPQMKVLSSPADIVITGGAAGGGKTWSLLIEPLRHVANPHFGAVFFRRTYPQITNEGGLWDEAMELYPLLDGMPNEHDRLFRFPSGMTVSFRHLQHEKDARKWTGSQVPLFDFDQLEEFEAGQFWYIVSRMRSPRSGVRPYLRASANPVPPDDEVGGWLNQFIAWWWDPATGYAIPERSGVIRWFVRHDEEIHWANTAAELQLRFPKHDPLSVTFIPSTLDDNPALTTADPGYRGRLEALPLVERERLLKGNWLIKPTAGKLLNRAWFSVLPAMPTDVVSWVRYWDKAGTAGGGKYSAGVLMGRRSSGRFVIADVVRGQWGALDREAVIKTTADVDRAAGRNVTVWVEQEPGSGGKESAENTVRNLAGHVVHAERVTGDKLTRSGPFRAQAEAKNVELVLGPWNEPFLSEAQNYDGVHGVMDQIDATSGAFNKLTGGPGPARVRELVMGR